MYIYDLVDKQPFLAGKLTIWDLFPGFDFNAFRRNYNNINHWWALQLQNQGIMASRVIYRRKGHKPMQIPNVFNTNFQDIYGETYWSVVILGGITMDIVATDTLIPTNFYFKALKKENPDVEISELDKIFVDGNNMITVDMHYLITMNVDKFQLPIDQRRVAR